MGLKIESEVFYEPHAAFQFMLDHQMIPPNVECPKCDSAMYPRCISGKYIDKKSHTKSMMAFSWFRKTILRPNSLLLLLWLWCEHLRISSVSRLTSYHRHTVSMWFKWWNELVAEDLSTKFQPIGGYGKSVQVHETHISSKSECNEGKSKRGFWVLGGIEEDSQKIFLSVLKDRSRSELVKALKANILPGTVIFTDDWKGYSSLVDGEEVNLGNMEETEGMEWSHSTVCHKKHFVNPDTGAHTQKVKGMWNLIKKRLRQGNVSYTVDDLSLMMDRFVWERNIQGHGKSPDDNFMAMVSLMASNRPSIEDVFSSKKPKRTNAVPSHSTEV